MKNVEIKRDVIPILVIHLSEKDWMRVGQWVIVLLVLGGFLTSVYAQIPTPRVTGDRISYHTIDVTIERDGSASVNEQFFFTFFGDEDLVFIQDFEENTPSLSEWKKDYPFIHPYIGLENQVEGLEFLLNYTVGDQPTLTLSYEYPAGLVERITIGTQGRSTRWKLSEVALLQFTSAGTIVIGSNTQVKIQLPAEGIVDNALLPPGTENIGNVITLTNFQSNAVEIQYVIFTPIADPIDFSRLMDSALRSPLLLGVIVALGLVAVYVGINREHVSQRVENYIIDHSEFRPPPRQEIEDALDFSVSEKKG